MPKRPKGYPKMWLYTDPKPLKSKVPEYLKTKVTEKAEELLEQWRPKHIKQPMEGYQYNYIVELYTTWIRSCFYFCAKYACPGVTAISPFFESRFARLEYVSNGRFNLSFMRHTGQWIETERGLTIDQCLKAVREDGLYCP